MPKVLLPPTAWKRFLRKRHAWGGDRHDEVWNGVYVLMPLGDNQHQKLGLDLALALTHALGDDDAIQIFPACNVSDDQGDWTKNFRCPDVAVFLPGNPAEDRDTHWLGGPDFAVEIISRDDRARQKFAFYAKVGVRELLLIDRRPWALELHRRRGDNWDLVGTSEPQQSAILTSLVLSSTLRLVPGEPRPRIEVARTDRGGRWLV
jgi:Uma2 family endonuclease